jgi:hypothetical protein
MKHIIVIHEAHHWGTSLLYMKHIIGAHYCYTWSTPLLCMKHTIVIPEAHHCYTWSTPLLYVKHIIVIHPTNWKMIKFFKLTNKPHLQKYKLQEMSHIILNFEMWGCVSPHPYAHKLCMCTVYHYRPNVYVHSVLLQTLWHVQWCLKNQLSPVSCSCVWWLG